MTQKRIFVKLKGGCFNGRQVDKACNCQLRIDSPFDFITKKIPEKMVSDCIHCDVIYSKQGIFSKYHLFLSDMEVFLNENYDVVARVPIRNAKEIRVFGHPFKQIKLLYNEVFRNESVS